MPDLVGRFGDYCGDPAAAQVFADRSRGVRLVAPEPVRAGSWSTATIAGHTQVLQQDWQHGSIASLAGTDQHDQGQAGAVDELVDLGAQTASGTADSMVRGLCEQILVIRQIPLCAAPAWWRADGHG